MRRDVVFIEKDKYDIMYRMNTTYSIVDNDALVLQYLQLLLHRSLPDDYTCLWACSSGKQAIQHCLVDNPPDALLVDMSMGEINGINVIKSIRERNDRIVLIGMTSYTLDDYVLQVAQAGAQALVHKDNIEDIVSALQSQSVPYGCSSLPQYIDYFYTPQVAFRKLAVTKDVPLLSPREMEIMRLCGQGASTKEIAEQLKVKVSTVNTQLQRIYGKLHVHSRLQALAAFEHAAAYAADRNECL